MGMVLGRNSKSFGWWGCKTTKRIFERARDEEVDHLWEIFRFRYRYVLNSEIANFKPFLTIEMQLCFKFLLGNSKDPTPQPLTIFLFQKFLLLPFAFNIRNQTVVGNWVSYNLSLVVAYQTLQKFKLVHSAGNYRILWRASSSQPPSTVNWSGATIKNFHFDYYCLN